MENSEHLVLDTRIASCPRESLEILRRLFAHFQPLEICKCSIRQFLTAGLNRKVLLRLSNLRLSRISVLRDQVASKTRKMVIFSYLSPSLATRYWVTGSGKVMVWVISRLPARLYGFFYRVLKTLPFRVPKMWLQFSSTPIFNAVLVDFF